SRRQVEADLRRRRRPPGTARSLGAAAAGRRRQPPAHDRGQELSRAAVGWVELSLAQRNPPNDRGGSAMELLDNQLTNLWLYPIKLGNQAADLFFYDVGNLEPSEWERLSPLAELKGTIIVASPRSAQREDKLRHYKGALRFMIEEGDGIKAIAVAGVGSSVL